jgi:hypothetical protein
MTGMLEPYCSLRVPEVWDKTVDSSNSVSPAAACCVKPSCALLQVATEVVETCTIAVCFCYCNLVAGSYYNEYIRLAASEGPTLNAELYQMKIQKCICTSAISSVEKIQQYTGAIAMITADVSVYVLDVLVPV